MSFPTVFVDNEYFVKISISIGRVKIKASVPFFAFERKISFHLAHSASEAPGNARQSRTWNKKSTQLTHVDIVNSSSLIYHMHAANKKCKAPANHARALFWFHGGSRESVHAECDLFGRRPQFSNKNSTQVVWSACATYTEARTAHKARVAESSGAFETTVLLLSQRWLIGGRLISQNRR